MTGRNFHEFRLWRRNFNGGIKPVTEKTQMDTLRVFIRFLETIDAVRPDLSEKVLSPDLESGENVRDVMLKTTRAEAILEYVSIDVFTPAVSLGGTESFVDHPATMSASYLSEKEREAAGIPDSLIRIPVGTERVDDLITDLVRHSQTYEDRTDTRKDC